MDTIKNLLSHLGLPRSFHVTYIFEILLLTILIYEVIIWVKNTRAWTLLKGIIVVVVFVAVCYIFKLTTLTWLLSRIAGVLLTMVVILFQPELRRALEQLGRRNYFGTLIGLGDSAGALEESRSQDKVNDEIIKAVLEMSKAKTGALIVIENQVSLNEYERTGIAMDAYVSSQLLVNIFEKNTPLHDGAVFIRDQRIVAATCYLPLSDNMDVGKELGTRHRAGLGISEVSDSVTIIVSEETGDISIAEGGMLRRRLDKEKLQERLSAKQLATSKKTLDILKGMIKSGKQQADS